MQETTHLIIPQILGQRSTHTHPTMKQSHTHTLQLLFFTCGEFHIRCVTCQIGFFFPVSALLLALWEKVVVWHFQVRPSPLLCTRTRQDADLRALHLPHFCGSYSPDLNWAELIQRLKQHTLKQLQVQAERQSMFKIFQHAEIRNVAD